MIAIRKAWWAALVLTVFIGCGTEEPAGDNPPPAPPSSSESPAPPATPSASEASKEGTSAESALPPVKEAAPAPTEEAPKPEGELKLDAPAVTPPAKEEGAEKKEEPKKDAAASATLLPAEIAELASLSPADKQIALKQVVCPVSGGNLGSMGAPIKVSAEGKTFMLCCEGCSEEVKDNPKEVVAKLKK